MTVRLSDQFTENEREYVAGLRVRSFYGAAVAAHAPARRPATGEVPGLRTMATAHLNAGVRDARRILSEALAAAQHDATTTLAGWVQLYTHAALCPGFDEDELRFVASRLMHLEGARILPEGVGVDGCVALLEGWARRQRLAAGGAR